MTTRYFVDSQGKYLGGFDGAEPPANAVEVPGAPPHGKDVWNGSGWVSYAGPTQAELEADCVAALSGGTASVDPGKVIKAKFISDLAFRLGKAPGALTNGELTAERNRIAAIYKTL